MIRFRQLVLRSVAFAVVLVAANHAEAHDLRLKVDTQREPIAVTAWFGDDDPADHAKVTITDEAGEVIASGTTDDKGVWTFPRPNKGGMYKAVVESIGHREEVPFPISETGVLGGEYTGWRLNKWLGIAIGLTLLLGGSALFWYVRRSRVLSARATR